MSASRSSSVTDAQLTHALTVEAEAYSIQAYDFDPAVSVFDLPNLDRVLSEILFALEESDLSSYSRPRLIHYEDASGRTWSMMEVHDYTLGRAVATGRGIEHLVNDQSFMGWTGVLAIVRSMMDIIDGEPAPSA